MRISDWSSDVCSSDLSLLALGRNHDRAMSRGVARRRLKTNLINNDVIGVDEERQAGIEDGCDGVGHDGDRVTMIVRAKMLEFGLGEDISGIGKGRHPCSINEHGITAAMVKVQVRAEHIINRSEEHTSELQSLMRISYAVFCLKQNTKT